MIPVARQKANRMAGVKGCREMFTIYIFKLWNSEACEFITYLHWLFKNRKKIFKVAEYIQEVQKKEEKTSSNFILTSAL